MRFTETKKRKYWLLVVGILIVCGFLAFGFCEFSPAQKTVQKTLVFEAD